MSPLTFVQRVAALMPRPPLADGGQAWEARLALIDRAERSLDAQTYSIAADASGHAFIGALRRAAALLHALAR